MTMSERAMPCWRCRASTRSWRCRRTDSVTGFVNRPFAKGKIEFKSVKFTTPARIDRS